jgi:hypothetical protein
LRNIVKEQPVSDKEFLSIYYASGTTLEELEEAVEELTKESDWEPLGAVTYGQDKNGIGIWVQTMTVYS